jgi:hypothetical protein
VLQVPPFFSFMGASGDMPSASTACSPIDLVSAVAASVRAYGIGASLENPVRSKTLVARRNLPENRRSVRASAGRMPIPRMEARSLAGPERSKRPAWEHRANEHRCFG